MSILIVDDAPDSRELLHSILKSANYPQLLTADSAHSAFSLLGMEGPDSDDTDVDLILMDIMMPGMHGIDACRRIKSVPRLQDIPVVMVTSMEDFDSLNDAFDAGAIDYVTKPIRKQELRSRVRSALALKNEMDARKRAFLELENAYSELEMKNRELEESSASKSRILVTMSHELRTPLTSIVALVDRMILQQEKVGPLNDRQRRYLEGIQESSAELKMHIDDLLDVARIEADQLELQMVELEPGPEIQTVMAAMRPQAADKSIELVENIASDLRPIDADRARFFQIVAHLVSNACKFSPPDATITIEAKNEPGRVRIAVSDSGVGLSEDERSQLFTKFFRADNSLNREVAGTGLGLYIAKHLVNAHNGDIWVESVEGRGSTFTFTVPWWDPESNGREPTDFAVEGEA